MRRVAISAATLLAAALASCGGHDAPSAPATGSLRVTVSGLPPWTPAGITVTGPGQLSRHVAGSETLGALPPGSYAVTAAEVTTDDSIYAALRPQQTVVVAAGGTPATASVDYAVASGALAVTIAGLPAGASAGVTVSASDGGFTQKLTASATLTRLHAGGYTVTASTVTAGASTYLVTAPATTVTVTPGATAAATVDFALAAGANLVVEGAYVVQSVQRLDRSVPLVQGKDGLVRVFVRASQPATPSPAVRVRFYRAGALVYERTIGAPTQYAPTAAADANESALASTWNVPLPGEIIQPGLTMTAEVDPGNAVPEVDETDNVYPASGQPLAADVRSLAPLRLRFVPVYQSAANLLGDVSPGNVAGFLAVTRKIHPVAAIDADVRAPYTTTGAPVSSTNDDTTWTRVLHEIDVARDLDPDGADRYYYGVVHVAYTSGVAGLGYIGYPVAMGWDYLPSGSEVMAHELGHNWGRYHAPCGVDNPDARYPYPAGRIGAYGYDVTTQRLELPTAPDIMGYCAGKWISDYTYTGVLNYRAAFPAGVVTSATSGVAASGGIASAAADASATRGPVQRCLLVWGRVVDGRPSLEPAFEVMARPSLPRGGGPLTLSAASASGATLWSLSFAGTEVADSPRGDRTFTFAIPVDRARPAEIAALRLAAAGRETTARVTESTASAADVRVARTARPRWLRVRWDAARHPVVMVRDPRSGAVLSFARGGDAQVRTAGGAAREVDVEVSDRVRSVSRRVTVTAP